MRFTPALPLGAESLCELLEVVLAPPPSTPPPAPDEVAAALARELPEGFSGLRAAGPGEEEILGRIAGVVWRFYPGGGRDAGALVEEAERRLASGAVTLPARRRGRASPGAAAVRSVRSPAPGTVEVECAFGPAGTLRPAEILEGLLGLDAEALPGTRIVRAAWVLTPPEPP
jgi:hypothetical protein